MFIGLKHVSVLYEVHSVHIWRVFLCFYYVRTIHYVIVNNCRTSIKGSCKVLIWYFLRFFLDHVLYLGAGLYCLKIFELIWSDLICIFFYGNLICIDLNWFNLIWFDLNITELSWNYLFIREWNWGLIWFEFELK